MSWQRSRWLLVTALATLAFALALAFLLALPEPLFESPVASILLDRDDRLLSAVIASDEQWRFPPGAGVPAKYRAALIEFEDRRFDRHFGFDPIAIVRAAHQNWRAGRVVSGGSTLSMQVIRLARGRHGRSYWQKCVEMLLALRLEVRLEKEEILALHAENAPFGGNVVGLEAAAWRYFGRSPHDLSWAESATLAVLPNSPALIHPGRNRDALEAKRNRLLDRLHARGVLAALDLELAKAEPLPEEPLPLPQRAPHLLQSLRNGTVAGADGGDRRFATTLDGHMQTRSEAVIARHLAALEGFRIHNAAALVIDNRTLEVRAYVGNGGIAYEGDQGRAVDIVQRRRSTGSVLKPFLYAAMLQSGEILPGMLVPDVPTRFDGYAPENFDRAYRGAVPAKIALARSLNVPAVRMLREFGVGRFHRLLRELGMTTLHRGAEDYGLTLILGGAEGTLWEMSQMYAGLARSAEGDRVSQFRVVRGGKPVAERGPVITTAAAFLTLDALTEVNRPLGEAGWREFSGARKIAWKTGTSYGLRDAWAIGVTPSHTIGVWVGNANGEGRAGLSGVATAGPILFDLFGLTLEERFFTEPRHEMKPVRVCSDDGYLATDLCNAVTQWVPAGSHFGQVSPHHRLVHLDSSEIHRVDSRCESVSRSIHLGWFVLPPAQEWYYRRSHPGYRVLPPYRKDCLERGSEEASPIALLYPSPGVSLYIPFDLEARRGRAIFEAVHRNAEATLHWHLDGDYVGSTETFHSLALDPPPGPHRLTLVDDLGNRLVRGFEVLGRTGS